MRVGKSQSAVANKLRLLRHSPKVIAILREKGLSERHARALLKLTDEGQKLAVIREICARSMNVARTEAYIDQLVSQELLPTRQSRNRSPDVRGFLSSLSSSLALIQSSGIAAVSHQQETEREIVLTITIPKQAG